MDDTYVQQPTVCWIHILSTSQPLLNMATLKASPLHHRNSSSWYDKFTSGYAFRVVLFLILSLGILYKTLHARSLVPELSTVTSKEFDWQHITPSKNLIYTDCFDGFQCARLDLPLDWNNTDGPRFSMAIVSLPAKVSVVDPRYGGIIILNPGGPGGSGVQAALARARGIQVIADSDIENRSDAKYFSIMSFDPRGVNNSSPKLNPFPDAFSQYQWQSQIKDEGTLEIDFEKIYVRSRTLSASSSHERDAQNGIGRFSNTSPVVADMVEFLEQHGRWREAQGSLWLASSGARHQPQKAQVLERIRWRKGEEKLNYWGFSYGTLLGATFSAMQPHRVERVILDGNVHLDDYYNGGWLNNLQDTDLIMDKFTEYCHQSGPESCSLYDSSASTIMEKIERLLSSLKISPKGVPATGTRGPEVITYRDVMWLIRGTSYSPLRDFPRMANLLEDLITGNGSDFANHKSFTSKPPCISPDQSTCEPLGDVSATTSIVCTDAEISTNTTKEEFEAYVAELKSQSKWIGAMWAEIMLSCTTWELRPKWRFSGPIAGNTAHPLLLLNPTLDPVTPLRNAHETATKFNGSVVLEQNSEGHCTYAAPSLCTAKHIRNYFQTGELPPQGTVCLPESRPFIGSLRSPEEPDLSPQDRKLLDALEELTRVGAD